MAEQIHFNLDEIPRWQLEALCEAVIAMVQRVKSDPAKMAEFEEWKKARDAEKKK